MKTDIEIPVRSEKPRTAALVKWLTKKGVEKMQEERDQWVTQLQQIIPEHYNQIQVIQYQNIGQQEEIRAGHQQLERYENTITHLTERYVDHAGDSGKDKIIIRHTFYL